MKKYIIVLFLFLIAFCLFGCNEESSEDAKTEYFITLFNDGLASSSIYDDNESKKKYGYFNEKFEVVIDFVYDEAKGFNNGLAIVKQNNSYFLIDTSGKKVSKDYYSLTYDYENKVYYGHIVTNTSSYDLLNNNGELLCSYREIHKFSYGYAVVCIDEQKYGLINTNGELVLSEYLYVDSFRFGYSVVIDKDYNSITIDTSLKELYNFGSTRIEYSNGCVVIDSDNGKEVRDVYGKLITTLKYGGTGYFKTYYQTGYSGSECLYKYNSDIVIDNIDSLARYDKYMLIFKDHTLFVYDYDFNIIEEVKFSDDVIRFNTVDDKYRNKVYLQLYSKETKKYVNYLFDKEKGTLERVKFLDKYDDLSGIYKDYLSVIEDDLYGLVTLSGSVVFKTDSKSNYAATDDGYIVNNSDITIYKHNKKKVYQNEDWYAIIIHRGE